MATRFRKSNGSSAGPAATLDAADLPCVLAHIEREAHSAGVAELAFTVPTNTGPAISWALEHGYRIDAFYEMLLADSPFMRLDRYVMSAPGFMW